MKKLGMHTLSIWFGFIMVLLVSAGAFVFIFTGFMDDRLFGTKRLVFILILIAYAVYRSIRLYQVLKQSRHEE